MEKIDLDKWKGKKHFLWFSKYEMPYYGFTSKIDCTNFYDFVKKNNLPFYITMLYVVTKALNRIEEFRLRIIDNELYRVSIAHPAFTIMTDSGVYDNCECEYDEDYNIFRKRASEAIEKGKKQVDISKMDNSNRYDQIYITSIPWISISTCYHPMTLNKEDCFPRIVWDKLVDENGKKTMNFSIQVNHCVCDGYPLSQGFIEIQNVINNIEKEIKL